MKKVKFKRKSKRIFFNTHFIALILVVVVLGFSSAYALLTQDLKVTGNVSGQKVYTYYFEKPSNWRGDAMHAHVWTRNSNHDNGPGTSWPGLAMQKVSDSIYKIEITSDMEVYSTHNYIIFNDMYSINDTSGSQTVDIKLDSFANNNQLFSLGDYNRTDKIRVFVQVPNSWSKVYAYTWNGEPESSPTFKKNANWPGVEITNNKFSADGYFYEINKSDEYKKIIFNKGQGGTIGIYQTADLDVPMTQDMTCKVSESTWSKYYTYGSWHEYILPSTLQPSHSNN